MFNYNKKYLKRDMRGAESSGGGEANIAYNTMSKVPDLPDGSLSLLGEARNVEKVNIKDKTKSQVDDLNIHMLTDTGVTVHGVNGLNNLKNSLQKQGYKIEEGKFLEFMKKIDFSFSGVKTLSIKGSIEGGTMVLDTDFNPLNNNGEDSLDFLGKIADQSLDNIEDFSEFISSIFEDTVKKYPSEALKAGIHFERELPGIDLKVEEPLTAEEMLQKIQEMRSEVEKKETKAPKMTETEVKTKEPKVVEVSNKKEVPKVTEVELKAEAMRKNRVNKLIKKYKGGNYENDTEMNGLVKELYNKNINVARKTTMAEMDSFESAMKAVDYINAKNLESQAEAQTKIQAEVEVKAQAEKLPKVSEGAKMYIDSKFSGIDNPNHAPSSKKAMKYINGEINPGTGLKDAVSDKIFKGDKTRSMTADEINYYNTKVAEWNNVRGLGDKKSEPQEVVVEKTETILEQEEKTKEQKEAPISDFKIFLGKRFKHISDLKIRTTRPQISVHGTTKNATTHPIPLENGGTAEMTAAQVNIYNKFAARWTELRKGKVEETPKIEEEGSDESMLDSLMNMFSSDEVSVENASFKEKIDSATNGESSSEASDYINKKFKKLDNPDYNPNQRKTHKEFKINSSGKQIGIITYIKVDGVRRPLNKNEISEYNKRVDEWNDRVKK